LIPLTKYFDFSRKRPPKYIENKNVNLRSWYFCKIILLFSDSEIKFFFSIFSFQSLTTSRCIFSALQSKVKMEMISFSSIQIICRNCMQNCFCNDLFKVFCSLLLSLSLYLISPLLHVSSLSLSFLLPLFFPLSISYLFIYLFISLSYFTILSLVMFVS